MHENTADELRRQIDAVLLDAFQRGESLERNPEFGGDRGDVMVDALLRHFHITPRDDIESWPQMR